MGTSFDARPLFSSRPRPSDDERYKRFRKAWHRLSESRSFYGPPLAEVYSPSNIDLPRYGWRDILKPPGNDGSLRINLRFFILFGWLPILVIAAVLAFD